MGLLPTTKGSGVYSESAGIFLTSDGKMWDVSSYTVNKLRNNGIVEDLEVERDDGLVPAWHVDDGGEVYKPEKVLFRKSDCVLKAVDGYLAMCALGKLTIGDTDWFQDNPSIGSDGVSLANILGIVQGLVSPYGIGIDRVYMPIGSVLKGEHREFAGAIGVNPQGAEDRKTSNDEFIASLGLDPESEEAGCVREVSRFEFVSEPKKPCIIMLSKQGVVHTKSATGTNSGGTWSTGAFSMGHAEYLGPRDRIDGDWLIAMTLKRNPTYLNGSLSKYETFDSKPKDVRMVLSVSECKIAGKKVIDYPMKYDASTSKANGTKNKYIKWYNSRNYTPGDYFGDEDPDAWGGVSDDKCPHCGASTSLKNGVLWCDFCGWWDYKDSKCLICGAATSDELCPYCGVSELVIAKENCKKHGCKLVSGIHKNKYFLICPECFKAVHGANSMSLSGYLGVYGRFHSTSDSPNKMNGGGNYALSTRSDGN